MDNFIGRICSRFCDCKKEPPLRLREKDPNLTTEQRATYALQLKLNPVWEEIFNDINTEFYAVWADTKAADVASRELLYQHFCALGLIKRKIEGYLSSAALDEYISKQKAATK